MFSRYNVVLTKVIEAESLNEATKQIDKENVKDYCVCIEPVINYTPDSSKFDDNQSDLEIPF